jgi:hypothetical protein
MMSDVLINSFRRVHHALVLNGKYTRIQRSIAISNKIHAEQKRINPRENQRNRQKLL